MIFFCKMLATRLQYLPKALYNELKSNFNEVIE